VINEKADADKFWEDVIARTLEGNHNGKNPFILSKYFESGCEIPRPELTSILERSIGEIKFQIADWRASLNGKTEGFHAVEYEDEYKCHIDSVDPKKNPLGHLIQDSPGTLVVAAALILVGAGSVVYYFKKKKEKRGSVK
jgi:hypothetical protein